MIHLHLMQKKKKKKKIEKKQGKKIKSIKCSSYNFENRQKNTTCILQIMSIVLFGHDAFFYVHPACQQVSINKLLIELPVHFN